MHPQLWEIPVPDSLGELDGLIRSLLDLLTASAPEVVDKLAEAGAGPEIFDVWRAFEDNDNPDAGWIIARSDGSGQFVKDLPEGEPIGPPIVIEGKTPVTDALIRLVDARREIDSQLPLQMTYSLSALNPDHFYLWWPTVFGEVRESGWQGMADAAQFHFENLVATGYEVGAMLMIASLAKELEGQAIEAGVGALLLSVTNQPASWPTPNPLALVQMVVDYVGRRAGLDAVEGATAKLLDFGERTRNDALDATNHTDFGHGLRRASPMYYGAYCGARSGRMLAEIEGFNLTKVSRIQTVADERLVTLFGPLMRWFEGPDGDYFQFCKAAMLHLQATEGEEAARATVEELIERLWKFPRAQAARLLGSEASFPTHPE